jgi:hypothetical protein
MDTDKMLDLSPLDPSRNAARWERLIGRIMENARPELARRATDAGVLSLLGNWAWPTLAAAGLAALLSGAALALTRHPARGAENTDGIVHFLGIAEPVAIWLDTERAPTSEDVMLLVEGEDER